ncbi:MAG: hypothetical protein AAFQ80_18610 [Cyanobacteria bacterium J06621_8]
MLKELIELLGDSQLWQELRVNDRRLVEENYDWMTIFAEYETQLALSIVLKAQGKS